MTAFIEEHRGRFGVEPICRVMDCNPSSYYAARDRAPSARALRDEHLRDEIARVHKENYGVYGGRKVWRQLNREGIRVARCTVARLMRELHLRGVRRGKAVRTTRPDAGVPRPPDLVERDFAATRPNQLWVADLTYVRTFSGFCYVALVIDVSLNPAVGGQVIMSLRVRRNVSLESRRVRVQLRRPSQRSRRVDDRPLQDGAHQPRATLADAGASRDRHARVHRLVEQPPPARRDRRRPTGGEGSPLLC